MNRTLGLVAYYFSWSSSVGARRAHGLARYLSDFGWDVVAIASPGRGPSSIDVPPVRVVSTVTGDRVLAARALRDRALSRRRRGAPPVDDLGRQRKAATGDGDSRARIAVPRAVCA